MTEKLCEIRIEEYTFKNFENSRCAGFYDPHNSHNLE